MVRDPMHRKEQDCPTNTQNAQISEWILLAASYVFVALRIYTRLLRLRRKLDLSDWLLVLSALDALALIICDTLTYQIGVLDEWEPSVTLSKVRNIRIQLLALPSLLKKYTSYLLIIIWHRFPSLPITFTMLEWASLR